MTPRQIYKKRHPKKFSDSKIVDKPALTKAALESHLLNLTKRNEQDTFEKFAIRLCELEICPNIKPNTGPAGGGDGKTDAESYPVSSATASGWYVGYENALGKQKIAFAVSAKKGWELKLKADLQNIKGANKKFTRTFFVTNQYVKADKRKDLEKDLGNDFFTDLHILDLSWILGKVYNRHRIAMAIKELSIDVDVDKVREIGPIDSVRGKRIDELETIIEGAISSGHLNYVVVGDAIDVAELSRQQELPRIETDGRLDRAIRLADQTGTLNQQFLARYQKCWTLYWYFEDYAAFKKGYNDAQKYAIKAGGINNLEKLSNLRNLLMNIRSLDKKLVPKNYYDARTKLLKEELKKIAANNNAPSSSLSAKVIINQIEMAQAFANGENIDAKLTELEELVSQSDGSPSFPFDSISEVVGMIGDALGDNEAYDSLYEKLTELSQRRDSEKRSAEMTLARAKTLIEEDKNYKAIQILGAALPYFQKEEMLEEASEALVLMGSCYENVGLYWAARGSYLSAASAETTRFFNEDEVELFQIGSYIALMTIELLLGRIPQVLQWHEIFNAFLGILPDEQWNVEALVKKDMLFDIRLGAAILTIENDPVLLAKIVPALERNELYQSSIAALYKIDRRDAWPKEFIDNIPQAEHKQFFAGWAKQVSSRHVPKLFYYYETKTVILRTRVVGCDISVSAPNNDLCIITGESILASIEGLLATTLMHEGIGIEPIIEISLKQVDRPGAKLNYVMDGATMTMTVEVPAYNPHSLTSDEQEELSQSLLKISTNITAYLVRFKDAKVSLEKILLKEKAAIRAIGFTLSVIRLGNVVGYNPKYRIEDWLSPNDAKIKPGKHPAHPLGMYIDTQDKSIDLKDIHQNDLKTVSIIRMALWDKAGWRGVVWSFAPGEPPVMALMFDKPELGLTIFEQWKASYENKDGQNLIRVAIMREIDPKRPHDYTVGISAYLEAGQELTPALSSATRVHTMNPTSSFNLNGFLDRYRDAGEYLLTVATIENGKMNIRYDLGILNSSLFVKRPKDVGDNDPDIALLK